MIVLAVNATHLVENLFHDTRKAINDRTTRRALQIKTKV
jgi:hypothetical protein